MLFELFDNPIALLSFALSLIIGLTIHEFAHAFIAEKLGDPTAKYQGRVTLNPLAHLDPFGSIMLLIAGFGWGKPVPVNPQYFSRPAIDELLVALAGPASNLIMASVLGIIVQFNPIPAINELLVPVVFINVMLAVFNLIPIPPLDGSKMLRPFVSEATFRQFEMLSLPAIILLVIALRTTELGNIVFGTASNLAAFFLGA